MFRRRADSDLDIVLDDDQDSQTPSHPSRQAGKGRATPKRNEVERRRREPYAPPPADRKAAAAQRRDKQQSERRRRNEAMRKGEAWALRPADRGPVRALARDYVDSRKFILSEFVLILVFVLIIVAFLSGAAKRSSSILLIEVGIFVLVALESAFYGAMAARLSRQRLPGQSTRGLTWYVARRVVKLRSARIPPARVRRGQEI